jgi:hypothetical protein
MPLRPRDPRSKLASPVPYLPLSHEPVGMSRRALNGPTQSRLPPMARPDHHPRHAPPYTADTISAVRFNNAQNTSAALLRSLFDETDVDNSGELDRLEVKAMVTVRPHVAPRCAARHAVGRNKHARPGC